MNCIGAKESPSPIRTCSLPLPLPDDNCRYIIQIYNTTGIQLFCVDNTLFFYLLLFVLILRKGTSLIFGNARLFQTPGVKGATLKARYVLLHATPSIFCIAN